MSNTINCSSCGASNQMPEGKNSMFCAFCGNSIEKINQINNLDESVLKIKPEITKKKIEPALDNGFIEKTEGSLSLINININSLHDIIIWYSDNELSEINKLDLSNNNIKSLDGIERFINLKSLNISNNLIENFEFNPTINVKFIKINELNISSNKIQSLKGISKYSFEKLNISNNKITTIDEFPLLRFHTSKLNFNNNVYLKNISDSINLFFDSKYFSILQLDFVGCDLFNSTELEKINFSKTKSIDIAINDNSQFSTKLLEFGFKKHGNQLGTTGIIFRFVKQNIATESNQNTIKSSSSKNKSGCFIATATMGSYEHPTVMELRSFRDNWVLQKSWGEGFVKYYYHYGAIVAKVIEKSFVLKKISYLLVVKPLVYLARIVKI